VPSLEANLDARAMIILWLRRRFQRARTRIPRHDARGHENDQLQAATSNQGHFGARSETLGTSSILLT
jgi:hypothetical protein